MGKNRAIATAVVAVILAGLVYLQFRTWTSFEWSRLLQYDFAWRHILHGIELIYLAYFLRALRWKIFFGLSASMPPPGDCFLPHS